MQFRKAVKADLPAIVGLLADDPLGATREVVADPVPSRYVDAFEEVERQTGNQIIVAVDGENTVKGCLQLVITPGLARFGMKRATIEGVRISRDLRGSGLGTDLFLHAIAVAKDHGCGLVQLTTDNDREDAHRFYERLGFKPSHVGMKLQI